MVVLASVAFGFTDPDFGIDVASLRLTLALMLGLLIVVLLPIAITRVVIRQRWSIGAEVVARPGAFLLAILGVLASRTIGFSPGILIGLVLGLKLAREARSEDRSRATAIRIASTLVIGIAAWVGYSWLRITLDGQPHTFGTDLMVETLAAAAVEGLSGIMVAVLPITFLEGKDLFSTSRRTWLFLAIPTAFAFALIVLPTAFTDEGPSSPLGLWIAVLITFSLLVAAVWAAFRFIPDRGGRPASEAAEARPERTGSSVSARSPR